MLQVLDALSEIAFNPDMLVSRLDKERKAVLAEAQMMNTIEYRVDCQLLQYLHEENLLGYRFPIGKTDQVLSAHGLPRLCPLGHSGLQ
jgi:predicted Zn-dependent peptidase